MMTFRLQSMRSRPNELVTVKDDAALARVEGYHVSSCSNLVG